MKTTNIPTDYQHRSPAGAEVRLLMNNHLGGMAHCTLKEGAISKAIYHNTVYEFWFILSGKGAIWRKTDQEESVSPLQAGVSIDIPLGTHFQYRRMKVILSLSVSQCHLGLAQMRQLTQMALGHQTSTLVFILRKIFTLP